MTTKISAAMALLGFLLMFGAVGGMEDPSKEAYFLEQCLVALVGIGLAFSGTLGLNNSQFYDER
jgi:peptidoglycan/LPS O-acetylase OafA/YrhL